MAVKKTKESAKYISKLYWRESNLMVSNSEILNELRNETLFSDDEVISKKSIENKLIPLFNKSLKQGIMSIYTRNEDGGFGKISSTNLYKESYDKYSKVLKVEDIKNNPYVKNINLKDISIKKSKIEYSTIKFSKGEMTPCDIEKYDEDYKLNFIVGIYDEDYESPALLENGNVWMNLVPSEFVTMQDCISKAHGNVLVFGLGLGYYQYMISLKDEVTNITIVEKNPKIIRLFEEYILPQFENKDKINIVKGDVFKLFNSDFVNEFDYCFVDTWFGRNDGLTSYLKLREKREGITSTVDYWLEEGFKATVRSNILLSLYAIACLEAPIEKIADVVPPDAMINPGSDIIYLKCVNYFMSNEVDLSTVEDVQKLLSSDTIINEILDFEKFNVATVLNKKAISATNNLHSKMNIDTDEYKWKKKKKKKKKKK